MIQTRLNLPLCHRVAISLKILDEVAVLQRNYEFSRDKLLSCS